MAKSRRDKANAGSDRGASSAPSSRVPAQAGWRKIVRRAVKSLMIVVPLAALAALGYAAYVSPDGGGWLAVRSVRFEGLDRLDEQTLRERMPNIEKNILRVDLDDIRAELEKATWVRSAVVRRRLPDEIVVVIEERAPAALARIGRDLQLVDRDGVVLGLQDPGFPLPDDAPIVLGLSIAQSADDRLLNTRRMSAYFGVMAELRASGADYSQGISEIDVAKPGRVAVIPESPAIPVVLGDRDYLKRYRLFQAQSGLFEDFRKKYGAIQSVDMTFEDQIIFKTAKRSENVSL